MVPYWAITFGKTRRIRANDRPWQAVVKFSNNSSEISCFNDVIKRESSSFISLYVGSGNSIKVINSRRVSGILTSGEMIITFFGWVFKDLLKFFNFRIIDKSFRKLS